MQPHGGVMIMPQRFVSIHWGTAISMPILACTGRRHDEDRDLTQSRRVFSMTCSVALCINAPAARVWRLLTDANDFPRWNSTVTRVEGQIREGERLRVRVPGTERTFTPRVSGVVPDDRMTWTGGFSPMFKGVRFGPIFERYANDLKDEAERTQLLRRSV